MIMVKTNEIFSKSYQFPEKDKIVCFRFLKALLYDLVSVFGTLSHIKKAVIF